MKRFTTAISTALVLVAGLSACGSGSNEIADKLDLTSNVRMINVAQQSPSVSLFRGEDSQAFALNKTYKAVSPYNSVSPGTATWSARTGTAPTTSIASATFDSQRGNRNSLLVLNSGAAFDMLLLTDPFGQNLTTDRGRIRFFGAAANAAAMDVYLTQVNNDITTKAPNFSNLQYRQAVPASGSDSFEFSPGDYRVQVTSAGAKTVLFSATITLSANSDWLFVAIPANDSGASATNAVKFLMVQGNGDANGKTSELLSTLP